MKGRVGKDRHAIVGAEGKEVEKLVGVNSVEAGESWRVHGNRRRS